MRRRPTPISDEVREAFLAALAEGHTVRVACERSGIPRSSAYKLRQRDEAFAVAWHDAYAAGTDVFEEEARRRAVEGVEKPITYRGQVVGHVREYSDRLLELTLKARRPEKFRDRFEFQHSGSIDLTGQELAALRTAGLEPEVEAAAALIAARLSEQDEV